MGRWVGVMCVTCNVGNPAGMCRHTTTRAATSCAGGACNGGLVHAWLNPKP